MASRSEYMYVKDLTSVAVFILSTSCYASTCHIKIAKKHCVNKSDRLNGSFIYIFPETHHTLHSPGK